MSAAIAVNNRARRYTNTESLRMASSGLSAGQSQLLVSPNVVALLPDVMIDYLWKLALDDGYREYEEQTFTLEPAKLGGQMIQVISRTDDCKRVFGVDPVQCKLRVLHSADCYQMALAG